LSEYIFAQIEDWGTCVLKMIVARLLMNAPYTEPSHGLILLPCFMLLRRLARIYFCGREINCFDDIHCRVGFEYFLFLRFC